MPEQPTPNLWVPPRGVGLLRFRATTRTVTLPNGERAKVTIDDSRTVKQIERNEGLDAVVSPSTIRVQVRGPQASDPSRLELLRRIVKGR